MPTWSNWAGNQRCAPFQIVHPSGTEQIVEAVTAAPGRIKVVGTGHSFTDAACTDGTLIELGRHRRLLAVDRVQGQVTVQSGITLADLNRTLDAYGLALPNLGDIEYQTASGALATGTHGTGAAFGCLATAVVGMELVTADGAVRQLEGAQLSAARVSIGALGVVSTLTLQCVPSFNLHAVEELLRVDEVLDRFDELAKANDHFEFYWMPRSRWASVKRNNRTDDPEATRGRWHEWYDDVFLPNHVFGTLGRLRFGHPRLAKAINRAIPKSGPVDYVERSHKVFTSPRRVRFCEMEYGFPVEYARNVFAEVRDFIASNDMQIGFPLEVRVTAADDIPLSMGTGRPSAFIACHVFHDRPYEEYFRGVERIMDQVGGRPHWGKLHFQTAATLAPRYAQWAGFGQARRELDPDGRFANAYTDRVLGAASAGLAQTSGQG